MLKFYRIHLVILKVVTSTQHTTQNMTDPFIKILFLLLLLEFSDLIASLITAIICFFLPTSANDKKRKELMAVKKNLHEELNETNMMDEFAKHAKFVSFVYIF